MLYLTVSLGPFGLLLVLPPIVLILAIPGLGVAILAFTPTERLRRIPVSLPLMAFLLWAAASYFWTDSTDSTMYVVRSELIPLLVMSLVAGSIPPRRLVRALTAYLVAVCAWSLVAAALFPMSRSIATNPYFELPNESISFRGTFGHKNDLGVFAVFSLAAVLPLLRSRWRRLVIAILVVAAVGTRSVTAISGLAALGFVWFWMLAIDLGGNRRDRTLLRIASFMAGSIAILSAFRLMPFLLDRFEKDTTFSGRTIIWAESIVAIARQPLQGFGYGGVWTPSPTPLTRELRQRIGFTAAHTHNAALELLLEVGVVGLVLMLLLLVSLLTRSVRLASVPEVRGYGRWGVLFIVSLVVMGLAEPLVSGPHLGFVVVVWVAISGIANEHERKPRRPPPTAF